MDSEITEEASLDFHVDQLLPEILIKPSSLPLLKT